MLVWLSFVVCFVVLATLVGTACGIVFIPFLHVRYVGRLFVKGSGKPVEILAKLNELAGNAPDEEIELFEVCLLICISLFKLSKLPALVTYIMLIG